MRPEPIKPDHIVMAVTRHWTADLTDGRKFDDLATVEIVHKIRLIPTVGVFVDALPACGSGIESGYGYCVDGRIINKRRVRLCRHQSCFGTRD